MRAMTHPFCTRQRLSHCDSIDHTVHGSRDECRVPCPPPSIRCWDTLATNVAACVDEATSRSSRPLIQPLRAVAAVTTAKRSAGPSSWVLRYTAESQRISYLQIRSDNSGPSYISIMEGFGNQKKGSIL